MSNFKIIFIPILFLWFQVAVGQTTYTHCQATCPTSLFGKFIRKVPDFVYTSKIILLQKSNGLILEL